MGVHFAIDASTAQRLLAADDDDELSALIEEIEMELLDVDSCGTDKAWDATHRCLTDGYLEYSNGTYPLNAVILGGRQLYEGDDYIVSLLVHAHDNRVGCPGQPVRRPTRREPPEAHCAWCRGRTLPQ